MRALFPGCVRRYLLAPCVVPRMAGSGVSGTHPPAISVCAQTRARVQPVRAGALSRHTGMPQRSTPGRTGAWSRGACAHTWGGNTGLNRPHPRSEHRHPPQEKSPACTPAQFTPVGYNRANWPPKKPFLKAAGFGNGVGSCCSRSSCGVCRAGGLIHTRQNEVRSR